MGSFLSMCAQCVKNIQYRTGVDNNVELVASTCLEHNDPIIKAKVGAFLHNSVSWKMTKSSGNSCEICLDDFIKGDDLVTLPCFHVFHSRCATTWFSRVKTDLVCPSCQTQISATTNLASAPPQTTSW